MKPYDNILTIILTKGLPASGKSTWAKQMVKDNPGFYTRINKDDLRNELHNGVWSKENEREVLAERDKRVLEALSQGKNPIIDDTNFVQKHEDRMRVLADTFMKENPNTLVIVTINNSFINVPLEECIKRDEARKDGHVGREVIERMYGQFLRRKDYNRIKPAELKKGEFTVHNIRNTDGMSTIISDLDGTLALVGDRNPYDRDFENDKANWPVALILNKFLSTTEIVLLSGRKEKYREQTIQFLEWNHVPYDALYMRDDDDDRPDVQVKFDLFQKYINNKRHVLFVMDDRNQVVSLWRELGLTVFQVADGDF